MRRSAGEISAFLAPGLLQHLSDDRFGQVLAGLRMLPNRPKMQSIGWPMGLGSVLGTVLVGILASHTSEPVLKLLLGLVLVAAALKTLYDHRG